MDKSEALNEYIEKLKASEEFSGSHSIKIEQFEGPIDLLLHLVKLAKINIEDIFVSHITEQYLSYMEQIKNLDLEKASDFIEVAAILIEIKAKSILPKNENEPDDNSAKRELIQKIEEFRLYKEASEKMKEKENTGAYYKDPDPIISDGNIVLRDMTMDGLMAALQKMFLKMEKKALKIPPRKIELDRFTVAEKMTHIKDVLLFRQQVSFFELFDSDFTKSEIITTFQALLELLKDQSVKAEQKEVFGDINITRVTMQE